MSVSSDYLQYVIDQLESLAPVVSRRMFGGVGLYVDEVFFGLIAEDQLYFKVDQSNRADYLAHRCEPFRPRAADSAYSMSYFQVPVEVLEDEEELRAWARKALAVATAAAAVKATKSSRRPKSRQRALGTGRWPEPD